VAGELGNTPAVCRRCYIHPEVFEAHRDGSLQRGLRERSASAGAAEPDGLTGQESAVLELLTRRLEADPAGTGRSGR